MKPSKLKTIKEKQIVSDGLFTNLFSKQEKNLNLSVGFLVLVLHDSLQKNSKLKQIEGGISINTQIKKSESIKLFIRDLLAKDKGIQKRINNKKNLILKIFKNIQRDIIEQNLKSILNTISTKKIKTYNQLLQEKQLLKKLSIQLGKFLDEESVEYLESIVKSSKTDVKVDSIYFKQIQARKKKIEAIILSIQKAQRELVAESFQRQILLEKIDKEDYDEMIKFHLGSDKKDWQKTYRKMANQYHPDKNPGDKESEEDFKAISNWAKALKNKKEMDYVTAINDLANRAGVVRPNSNTYSSYTDPNPSQQYTDPNPSQQYTDPNSSQYQNQHDYNWSSTQYNSPHDGVVRRQIFDMLKKAGINVLKPPAVVYLGFMWLFYHLGAPDFHKMFNGQTQLIKIIYKKLEDAGINIPTPKEITKSVVTNVVSMVLRVVKSNLVTGLYKKAKIKLNKVPSAVVDIIKSILDKLTLENLYKLDPRKLKKLYNKLRDKIPSSADIKNISKEKINSFVKFVTPTPKKDADLSEPEINGEMGKLEVDLTKKIKTLNKLEKYIQSELENGNQDGLKGASENFKDAFETIDTIIEQAQLRLKKLQKLLKDKQLQKKKAEKQAKSKKVSAKVKDFEKALG
jgi:hypothetical protein